MGGSVSTVWRCAVRCSRHGTRSPPTLTLPHNGGRESATKSAGGRALYKIIFSTHDAYPALSTHRSPSRPKDGQRRVVEDLESRGDAGDRLAALVDMPFGDGAEPA